MWPKGQGTCDAAMVMHYAGGGVGGHMRDNIHACNPDWQLTGIFKNKNSVSSKKKRLLANEFRQKVGHSGDYKNGKTHGQCIIF